MIRLVDITVDGAEDLSKFADSLVFEFYAEFLEERLVRRFLDQEQNPEAISRQIESGHRYAYIVSDDERIGYVALRPSGDDVVLSKLYIRKSSRGNGIGSEIMDMIIQDARKSDFRSIYLHVNRENEGAIRFYRKFGYVEREARPTDIETDFNQECYTMEYVLDDS